MLVGNLGSRDRFDYTAMVMLSTLHLDWRVSTSSSARRPSLAARLSTWLQAEYSCDPWGSFTSASAAHRDLELLE
jgi:hypothetical protein